MVPTSSPCTLDTKHWYIPLSAIVTELIVSCVFVSAVVSICILPPGVMAMPSLYHMTVAAGRASMAQVSVTVRPVRARCGPLTSVTSAGSEPRTEWHSYNIQGHTTSCTCTPLPKHSTVLVKCTPMYCTQHLSTTGLYSHVY